MIGKIRGQRNLLDEKVHAAIARSSWAVSPVSVVMASMDWALHMAASPGKRHDLLNLALDQAMLLGCYAQAVTSQTPEGRISECVTPPSFDKRFVAPEWQQWPFNVMHQGFLLADQWWHAATTGVEGVTPHHEHMVSFMARQWLDVFSPGNFALTNPVVLSQTAKTNGRNLINGMINALEDVERIMTDKPPAHADQFVVGKDLAVTPGKVVMQNQLAELIQYTPTTLQVYPEPVLIMPAWIMKYYILDLSPGNSLIEYLVSRGHTVFCISWKNPGLAEKDIDIDDYLQLGFFAALDAVAAILPGQKVHATGYCLGGTLLAIAAAFMARHHDDRLASLSLFTAQTDFREPGELALFIDESEVSFLEAQMNETGYLTAGQMAGAFQMLRSNDLMWSRAINEYLMGERGKVIDLMAWNSDATRMPAKMHGQYLRELFLNNALSEGRYTVRGEPVTLFNITTPIFSVATQADHVAPWQSVYKLHYLTPAEITFVLTTGGHNAGIVSNPAKKKRSFALLTRPAGGRYLPHTMWLAQAASQEGSWWPAWSDWLIARSGAMVAPPHMGATQQGFAVLRNAPGQYVHEK